MQYSVRHVTEFTYTAPVHESVMEVRMGPSSGQNQQCYAAQLRVTPYVPLFSYREVGGHTTYHFNIPRHHDTLRLDMEALVEVKPPDPLPDALSPSAWEAVDALADTGDLAEMLLPSRFVQPTDALYALAADWRVERRDDPLSLLREINAAMYASFVYQPQSTHVHSPIDDALRSRTGVCQDFTHVFLALVRLVGLPCRYVSGYLFHRADEDRSSEDATHAWAEVCLPELGWVGFDPTNNLIAGERHIRVAAGRDYDDVPPTRGVYKGAARSELRVGVQVLPVDDPGTHQQVIPVRVMMQEDEAESDGWHPATGQQQQ